MDIGRDERGGVLILVIVFLPVLLMFGTFVIDVGNWFEHKRHLQLQVDAGALAGAGVFASPCTNAPIEANARRYAGDPNPDVGSGYDPAGYYNAQVTNPEDVHVLINSTEFWRDGGSDFSDGGHPCQTRFVDVKATHDDLPWYFTVIPGVDNLVDINAHARVEILSLSTVTGALPIAVNDVNPKSGAVLFIDETKGSTDATQILDRKPMREILPASAGQTTWANDVAVAEVPIASRSVGAVLAFSGAADADGDPIPIDTSGTLAEICARSLVDCFDLTQANGVLYIRGWSSASVGATTPPNLRDVWLNSAAADPVTVCTGSFGNGEFSTNGADCSNALEARIALGIDDPSLFEFVAHDSAASTADVCPNSGCPLAYDAASQTWKGRFDLPSESGPAPLDLKWQRKTGTIDFDGSGPAGPVICTPQFRNNNDCSGTFGDVQRAFAAVDDRSGALIGARLSNADTGLFGGPAHSYEIDSGVACPLPSQPARRCQRLVVEATLTGNLKTTTTATSPPITLRVAGSQTGAVDCDPWPGDAIVGPGIPTLKEEIAFGCRPTYTVNKGTPCAATASALWQPQPPSWNCVVTQTGVAVAPFVQGFNRRVHGDYNATTCVAPNNFATQFPSFEDQEDSRIVQVFLTPFGSFSGSGNDVVPVRAFASFYITGWGGPSNKNEDPCNPTEPIPKGFLKGYFITYIKKLNSGGAGTEFCNLNDFGTCIAVLTR